MTREFVTYGPYEIEPEHNHRGAKHVSREKGKAFFERYFDLKGERGCYLFAIRTRGLRAVYVGKATVGFQQEVFTADKLQKLNEALHKWTHGTPVVMFVVAPERTPSEQIAEVERWLIRMAKRAWPELLNVHHTREFDWEIKGVTATRQGRRSDAEMGLVRVLKLDE